MRKETIIKDLVISATLMNLILFAAPTVAGSMQVDVLEEKPEPLVYQFLDIKEPNSLDEFIEAVGMLESGNRYYVENRYGMLGKYQFSPLTIEHLGYDVTREGFLTNPDLQDSVMRSYLIDNYNALHKYIHQYEGQVYKGVYINTATILAGAHFAGAGGMRKFLEDPTDSTGVVDGNGMSLVRYMSYFTDYNIVEVQCS